MPTITKPAASRAIAVQPRQPLALESDVATNWWKRNQTTSEAWSQINGGGTTTTLVWETPSTVTHRLTFDRIQLFASDTAPSTGETGGLHLNLCEGPPAVLWATSQLRNDAMEEPPLRPWEGEDDDPPLGLPLFMPAANRDRLGTTLLETVSEPGGPANLVGLYGPGLFVDSAGKLGARTPFTNDVRGLGPFPAIASYHHGGLYFQHDFGKSRTLGLTRVLYEDADGHVAIVRGDGRRNTYRWDGAAFAAAASLGNTLTESGGVYSETTPSGRVYRYDSAGKLDRVIDLRGATAYFTYDANSRLQKIQGTPGAVGLVPYLSYDGAGLLSRLVLEDASVPANNRTTYFVYNVDRNLERIIGPESCVTYFGYSGTGALLTSITDPEGFVWRAAHDGNDRVDRIVDALNASAYLSFDAAAALATHKDRAGRVTYFAFNAFGSPERVFNPGTPADYFTYDGEGNMTSSTNRLGRQWTFEVDALGNRIASTDPLGARAYFAYDAQDLLRTFVDPIGRITYLDYDAARNRTKLIDPVGNTCYYEYEPSGLLRSKRDRRGAFTYFAWDARANLSKVNDPLGHTTYFAHNSAGERTAVVDPLGRMSYLEFDKRGRVIQQTDPIPAATYFAYDARCNLVSQTDAHLETTLHFHDGNSNRTKTVDPLGHATYLAYDAEERVLSQKDARLFETTFTYDSLGRRQKQIDALGFETYLVFDAAHQLEQQVDARGHAVYLRYDAAGRVSHQVDAFGAETYFGFDLAGQRVKTTDALGRSTLFEHDPRGWLRRTETAVGAVTYLAFDEEGNRTRSVDPRGLATYFTYDLAGRLTHTTDQLLNVTYSGFDRANQTVLRLDPLGAPTYMAYDAAGRPQTTLDSAGLVTYHAYDLVGNLVLTNVDQGWGNQPWGSSPWGGERATTYLAYDASRRRQTTTDAHGGVTYLAHDRVGNVEFTVNARGFATYFTYDALSRRTHTKDGVHFASTYMGFDPVGNVVLQVDQQGATTYLTHDRLNRVEFSHDPAGVLTYHVFDEVGNRAERHVLLGAAGERRSTYFQFDAVNRTVRQIAADGGETYFEFDLAGNPVRVVDPEGRPTYLAFDELNRQSTRKNAFGHTWTTTYDERSSVARQIDPEGRTAYFGYDLPGRRLHQSNALGEFGYFFHDARGQRTHVLNPRGHSTYFRYDLLGRQTHRIDALGGVSYMAYDAVDNRTLTQDELGNATYFFFDGLNRTTRIMDAALNDTYMAYDSRSSLIERIDADGRGTYMAYDVPGRLERQFHTRPDTSEPLTQPTYYVYDQVANLKIVDDRLAGLDVTYFDHDRMDRVVKKVTIAGAVYYAFDLSGQKVHLRDPDLAESYYVYDAAGRLDKLQVDAGRTAYFAYDNSGMVLRRHSPLDEVVAYYDYDFAGRLKKLENRNVLGQILSYFAYERNEVGAQTRIRHEGDEDTYYEYDALDRLTREFRLPTGTGREHDDYYAYDAVGNRALKIDRKLSQNVYYTFDTRNLMAKEWNKDAPETTYFEYDNARRMTSLKLPGGQSSYFSHDQRDQVQKIEFARATSPDSTQEFGYTGAGERVKLKVGDGVTTDLRLAYDGKKLLTEKNAADSNNTVRRYRHNQSRLDCGGSAIEWEFGGPRLYGAFNAAGTLASLVRDFGGGEIAENSYIRDAFGRMVSSSTPLGSDGGRLQFLSSGLIDLQLSNVQMNATLFGGGCFLPSWGVLLPGGQIAQTWLGAQVMIASGACLGGLFFAPPPPPIPLCTCVSLDVRSSGTVAFAGPFNANNFSVQDSMTLGPRSKMAALWNTKTNVAVPGVLLSAFDYRVEIVANVAALIPRACTPKQEAKATIWNPEPPRGEDIVTELPETVYMPWWMPSGGLMGGNADGRVLEPGGIDSREWGDDSPFSANVVYMGNVIAWKDTYGIHNHANFNPMFPPGPAAIAHYRRSMRLAGRFRVYVTNADGTVTPACDREYTIMGATDEGGKDNPTPAFTLVR